MPSLIPPGFDPLLGWIKLKGAQGYKDPEGLFWKLDRLHHDHWDVSDRQGNKVREVRFDGSILWPGRKNKNKEP